MQLTQNSLRSENASIPNATIVAVVVAFDRNDTSTALSFTANSEAFVTRDPTVLRDCKRCRGHGSLALDFVGHLQSQAPVIRD